MPTQVASAKPNPRRALGDFGERVAVRHLEANGYRILDRNWRTREGEIDIVAEAEGTVAFVEVRCKRGALMGTAGESLTPAKQRRMVTMTEVYESRCSDLPPGRRIDLIAIDLTREGRLISLQHFESAITAE